MDRDRVLRILREHEAELKAAGVEHLRLFGSIARGEGSGNSDVDLAVTMNPNRRWTLLTIGGIQMDLCDMLGTSVDLALTEGLKPPISERVLAEGVDAF